MKKMTLLFGSLLLLALVFLPVRADAVESGECGTNVTWSLDGTVLTISGTGEMTNYTYTDVPWKSARNSITAIVITNGVTSIGENAFRSCFSVQSLMIPNGVVSIGESAFQDCSGLSTITIPRSVTSIGDNAFGGCSALENVYYRGTQEQWSALNVVFDEGASTTVHYGGPLSLVAEYDKDTNIVTVTIKTTETITLSNYDAVLSWDDNTFTLTSITNGQSGAFPSFEKNTIAGDPNIGTFAAMTSGDDETVNSDAILATCTFGVKDSVELKGNYSFGVGIINAADKSANAMSWVGESFSSTIRVLSLTASSFDNRASNLAELSCDNPVAGDFTVTCARPCVVIYYNGTSYQRLTATAVNDPANTYSFTLPNDYDSSVQIVICLKCDFTGDGKINSTDALQTLRVSNGSRSADGVQRIVADFDNDGTLNSTDAYNILKLAVGTASVTW